MEPLFKVLPPSAQGLGIVASEGLDLLYPKTMLPGQCTDHPFRRQHAAGKDVLLDEVRPFSVRLEMAVVDGDGLDVYSSAGFQQVVQIGEVGRPIGLSHRFEHLDGDDVVIAAVQIPVVPQLESRQRLQPRPGDALSGIAELSLRQGHAVYPNALGCGIFGKTAPAAADLQHRIARLGTDSLQHALVFEGLGPDQTVLAIRSKAGAGVGHAGVQPQLVEVVAQVVVGLNVFRAALARVAPQQVFDAVTEIEQAVASDQLFQCLLIPHPQPHQGGEIAGLHEFVPIALGQADIAVSKHSP